MPSEGLVRVRLGIRDSSNLKSGFICFIIYTKNNFNFFIF